MAGKVNLSTIKDYKLRLKNRISWILAGCIVLFLAIYLPRSVQEKFLQAFGDVKVRGWLFEYIYLPGVITGASGIPLIIVFRWILFAQDQLATGSSRASIFFRHYYVTSMLTNSFPEIGQSEAQKLWFDTFNRWQKSSAKDTEADLFRRISERTYSLRLIWYLKHVLGYFAIGSIIMMSLDCAAFHRPTFVEFLPVKLFILLIVLVAYLWLHLSNSFRLVSSDGQFYDRYEATGAFALYKEIQGLAWEFFRQSAMSKWKIQDGKLVKSSIGLPTNLPQ